MLYSATFFNIDVYILGTPHIRVEPNLPTEKEIEKDLYNKFDASHAEAAQQLFATKHTSEELEEDSFAALVQRDRLVLSVQDLYKRFGKKQAVNGVSFDIHTGEIVGFLGPNGAGKTTVFYMIVGFIRPDKGKIFFNETNMASFAMYKRARLGISYLPQESSVFRRLSVEKNIMAVLQAAKGISRKEKKERLERLIKDFGLQDYRKQRAYTLSGGERRRTEIARGMALYPYFLLLDEPFTGIDPKARHELKQIIASLSDKGVGVLITDHNERDTLSITNRAFILHEGVIVASGTRQEITNNVKAREIYLGEDYE